MEKSLPVGVAAVKMDAVVVGPDGKVPPEAIKADMVRELEQLYRETDDRDYWLAARKLEPISHNPEKDDRLALAWMAALVEGGHCSANMASKCVAYKLGEDSDRYRIDAGERSAMQRRIYEKFTK
jgi:hypothetical protein